VFRAHYMNISCSHNWDARKISIEASTSVHDVNLSLDLSH
jgi:hypothetical protein